MIISKGSRLSKRPAGEKNPDYGRSYSGAFGSGPLSDQPFYRKNGVCHCQGRSLSGGRGDLGNRPCNIAKARFANVIEVTTAREMFESVTLLSREQDWIIKAAAVADYRPSSVSPEKVKKKTAICSLIWNGQTIFWHIWEHISGKDSSCADFLWKLRT